MSASARGRHRFSAGPALICTLTLFGWTACRPSSAPPLEITLGTRAGDKLSFAPRSAFFEYLELPGQRNELEITLASYDVSCERYVSPEPGQISVRVVLVTPAGLTPVVGEYFFSAPNEATQAATSGPAQPRAVPKASVGKTSYLFQPGGSIRLTRVVLERDGVLEGTLAFEFAGNALHPATSIKGSFRARMCRAERATRG